MLDISSKIINSHAPIMVVSPKGTIDSSNFQKFQEYIEELIGKGSHYILLNFAETSHISSAGLRVIHNLFNNLRSIHKDVDDDELRRRMSTGGYKSPYLKLCSLSPNVAEVFSMGGFDIYIEIFADENAALNSF